MSEQEMDLDTAIQLFDLVENFDEYEEGLREVLTWVHTQEELDRARVVIDEKKQYMIDNSPEFNAIMERARVLHEGAGNSDIETDAIVDTIQIEYV